MTKPKKFKKVVKWTGKGYDLAVFVCISTSIVLALILSLALIGGVENIIGPTILAVSGYLFCGVIGFLGWRKSYWEEEQGDKP